MTGDRLEAPELAVSELVGNAVRHGRPPVAYDITVDGETCCWPCPTPTRPGPADRRGDCCEPDAEGGRGLLLVAEVSPGWGWEPA